MAPPLNHKQKKFALEYRVDHNATAAALRAGYSSRGASQQGARLLANDQIRALIEAADSRALAKVEEKGSKVLAELATFAFSDLKDAFNADGTMKHYPDLPEPIRRAIKSFEVEELFDAEGTKTGRTVKVTLWPKDKGLELLGKNQKLFVEKHEHSVDEPLAQLLAAAHGADVGTGGGG